MVVDPPYASTASPSDLMVLDLLYDGLTRLAPDGTAAPAVATGWSADPGQRVWRFTLDTNARFTTDRAVLAADVVASLQHVMAGGDASPAAVRLEPVAGFRAYVDGTSPTVSGLQVVDDHTVEITLDTPLAQLPVLLAAPSYGVVDVPGLASVAAGGSGTTLPGSATPAELRTLGLTGSWSVGDAGERLVRLDRRPGAVGHLDAVELRPYEDDAAAFAAFEDEDVDWAPVPGDRYGEAVDAYGSDAFAPFAAELHLGLRVDGPVLSNPDLRKAIALALDRQAIIDAVYPEEATVLEGIVPTSLSPGRTDHGAIAQDVRQALALVRGAFPDGRVPTVHLDFEATTATAALMAIVARSLDDVGIPTELRPLALDAYQRLLVSGAQEVFTLSWLGGYASPSAYLDPLLRSSSPDNLLGLRDAGLDAALDAARATGDLAVAEQHWSNVERTALGAAFLIPIAEFRTQVVVADRVLHLRHALDGTVDWSAVEVAS